MTIILIIAICATCALAVVAVVMAWRQGRVLLWRRLGAILVAEYGAGVLLGCWPIDAILTPARPILDRLLVGGGS